MKSKLKKITPVADRHYITFNSIDDWIAKGKELFGDDYFNWEFICPSCGNIQKGLDFKPYENANLNDVYFNCIGRFTGTKNEIFSKTTPCNYTSGGLFNINKTQIKNAKEIGVDMFVFNFNIKDQVNG